jgi:enoyl-CoA hydratase
MPLHVERRGAVALLTLDDPDRRNALTSELVDAIVAAVADAEVDPDVGALVVTGAPPAFCSGADTSNLADLGRGGAPDGGGGLRGIYEGFLSVRDCALPTVAAVNGPAVGAGFNLALCCDVRIAATSASFDSRFVRIGLHPGGGHTWLLERAVGPQAAAAMVLFADRVDGRRAVEIGLAWRCVADNAVVDDAVALAARAADAPPELLRSVKATLREMPWQPDFESAVMLELERQRASFEQGWVTARLAGRDAPAKDP